MVDVGAARDQLAHHGVELFLHGAAHAAVGEFIELALLFDTVLVAADAAAAQDVAIDAQFAELVDDHRDAAAVRVLQDMAQQRGLAAAQKAGDDGGGNLLAVGHVHLQEKKKKGGAQRASEEAACGWQRQGTT
ncbi:hypothetical protein D3C71_1622960 [compost metagenome]